MASLSTSSLSEVERCVDFDKDDSRISMSELSLVSSLSSFRDKTNIPKTSILLDLRRRSDCGVEFWPPSPLLLLLSLQLLLRVLRPPVNASKMSGAGRQLLFKSKIEETYGVLGFIEEDNDDEIHDADEGEDVKLHGPDGERCDVSSTLLSSALRSRVNSKSPSILVVFGAGYMALEVDISNELSSGELV